MEQQGSEVKAIKVKEIHRQKVMGALLTQFLNQ